MNTKNELKNKYGFYITCKMEKHYITYIFSVMYQTLKLII
jgi:hypothetical protein